MLAYLLACLLACLRVCLLACFLFVVCCLVLFVLFRFACRPRERRAPGAAAISGAVPRPETDWRFVGAIPACLSVLFGAWQPSTMDLMFFGVTLKHGKGWFPIQTEPGKGAVASKRFPSRSLEPSNQGGRGQLGGLLDSDLEAALQKHLRLGKHGCPWRIDGPMLDEPGIAQNQESPKGRSFRFEGSLGFRVGSHAALSLSRTRGAELPLRLSLSST